MSFTRILSIDPGISGALALLDNTKIVDIQDMPIVPKTTGKGNEISAILLAQIIRDYCCEYTIDKIVMEVVRAMPGQGSVSMFSFGRSVGTIEGVLAGLQLPVTMVRPQVWKKHHGLLKKDKQAARTLVLQKYPNDIDWFKRKKDVDRADAVLMGLWLHNQL